MADENNDKLIPVSAKALRELLVALNGPGHYIRELQATRNLPIFEGEENPINLLTNQFNDWVNQVKVSEDVSQEQQETTDNEMPSPTYPLNEEETLGYRAFLRAWNQTPKGENHWFRLSKELQAFLQQRGVDVNFATIEHFFRGMKYGVSEQTSSPICSVGHCAKITLRVDNPVIFTDVLLPFFSKNQYSPDLGATLLSLE